MKFTVKNKRHVRFEDGKQVVYQVGDIIEANEAEAKAFRDKFEPVVEVAEVVEKKAKKTSKVEAVAAEAPIETPAEAGPDQI